MCKSRCKISNDQTIFPNYTQNDRRGQDFLCLIWNWQWHFLYSVYTHKEMCESNKHVAHYIAIIANIHSNGD